MTKRTTEPQWRTSSFTEGQDCVELASLDSATIGVRDSKNPAAGHLIVQLVELAELVHRIKAGHLDL